MTSRALAFALALICAQPAAAQHDSGAYLAGRAALSENHFSEALTLFRRALAADPTQIDLLHSVTALAAIEGQLAEAAETAAALTAQDAATHDVNLVLLAREAQVGDWQTMLDALDSNRRTSPIVDSFARPWAQVGLGHMGAALTAFDSAAETDSQAGFARQHKALALAMAGDLEGADSLFAAPGTETLTSRLMSLAWAEILSQLGRNDEARALLEPLIPHDPEAAQMHARLQNGETLPFTRLDQPRTGIAYTLMIAATAHQYQGNDVDALLHARLAEQLAPTLTEAALTSAEMLLDLGRPDLAAQAFDRIPADDPGRATADLGRARALDAAGQTGAALAVLDGLVAEHGDDPELWSLIGDLRMRLDRMEDAATAYGRAIELIPQEAPALWVLHYARAIALHDLNRWDAARADFRRALELNPNQPSVLNYLGYSMVERGEDLDEALGMIEQAVALDPDNGAIVDSLAWALFSLGRAEEAVAPMERAATLIATDPILFDHLGDIYWAVGRRDEAVFQWKRALSFAPEPELAAQIRAKLTDGPAE